MSVRSKAFGLYTIAVLILCCTRLSQGNPMCDKLGITRDSVIVKEENSPGVVTERVITKALLENFRDGSSDEGYYPALLCTLSGVVCNDIYGAYAAGSPSTAMEFYRAAGFSTILVSAFTYVKKGRENAYFNCLVSYIEALEKRGMPSFDIEDFNANREAAAHMCNPKLAAFKTFQEDFKAAYAGFQAHPVGSKIDNGGRRVVTAIKTFVESLGDQQLTGTATADLLANAAGVRFLKAESKVKSNGKLPASSKTKRVGKLPASSKGKLCYPAKAYQILLKASKTKAKAASNSTGKTAATGRSKIGKQARGKKIKGKAKVKTTQRTKGKVKANVKRASTLRR